MAPDIPRQIKVVTVGNKGVQIVCAAGIFSIESKNTVLSRMHEAYHQVILKILIQGTNREIKPWY
jgi:hypothetical protein